MKGVKISDRHTMQNSAITAPKATAFRGDGAHARSAKFQFTPDFAVGFASNLAAVLWQNG